MKNSKAKNIKNNKILVLLWHPKDMVAGGFIRTQKMLPFYNEFDITIVDNSPPLIGERQKNVTVITYKIPKVVKRIYSVNFYIGRIIEWLVAAFQLVKIGTRELRKGKYKIIYGPTGDNLHIFISGVILKSIFPSKRLILDVLNLDMPEGGYQKFYKSARRNNVPFLVATIQTYGMWVLLGIENILIKKCDYVVTVSPYMKKIISKYYPATRIGVTASGVDIPSIGKEPKTIDGIYIGRHTKEKGIFDFVKMACNARLNENRNFVSAGYASYEIVKQIGKLVKDKDSGKQIVYEGVVSEVEKWRLLSAAKIFFHLAYYEPLVPVISVLEALACGIPVIMYEVDSIVDVPLIKNRKSVIIVKKGDIREVIRQARKIWIMNELQLTEIRRDALSIAREYEWRKIARVESGIIGKLLYEE